MCYSNIQGMKNTPYHRPAPTGSGSFAVDLNRSRLCPYILGFGGNICSREQEHEDGVGSSEDLLNSAMPCSVLYSRDIKKEIVCDAFNSSRGPTTHTHSTATVYKVIPTGYHPCPCRRQFAI